MRNIYLIRHGQPEFETDDKYCIGRTDLQLSRLGKMEACILGEYMRSRNISTVFCSPLKRACQTAEYISPDYVVFPDLKERDFGDFDGLSFTEIKKNWPELYELRADDRDIAIPNAEDAADAKQRFNNAVDLIAAITSGNIAIVAHNTVIRLAVDAPQNSNLPYCGFYCNGIQGSASLPMTPSLAVKLRDAASISSDIKDHCDAVASEAVRIAKELNIGLDTNLIECSALLHDIAKGESEHESAGGMYLSQLGYEDIGRIIRQHGELDSEVINEAAVVFIADKVTRNTQHVSIEERYANSLAKCKTPESIKIHSKRMEQAIRIRNLIGKDILL